jgi:NCS1 family nucleobase:cation symporter-1
LVALAWGGLVIPMLRPLYDYAWFVGLLVSGGVYLMLMKTLPVAYSDKQLEPAAEPDGI